jgi:hypothetical protein
MEDWVFGKFWYGEPAGIENKSDKFMNEKIKVEESLSCPCD